MELPCSCFYCLVYLRNSSLYHMTTLKDQQKLYDNVIIKLDKKGTTRRTYGFYHLLLSAYCVSTWGKCCHCVSTHGQTQHNTTSERQRERKQECTCMSESQWRCYLKALNMTHNLNNLKQLGIKSSLGPRKLSFHSELLFMTQAFQWVWQ